MVDTLRSLAGGRFSPTDVLSSFREPLTPEELVLDRYVFLPHVRVGISAALSAPFGWDAPARATVTVTIPVVDDRGELDAEQTVHVHGPGQVTEVDHRQVVRTFPRSGAVDAEVDDLCHVEFDRPDLPWLFTPTGPDAAGNLVPWITLVVADKRRLVWGKQSGTTRIARIRRDQLQPLHDAWAWAHAQVMGAKQATAAAEPTLERRVSEANAAHNLSRLVCPRRLDDRTAYVACVVPTFLAGVRRGLGLAPEPTLAPAWGTAANPHTGDPMSTVELPVYYSWEFGTGQDGNFESLARKLRPAVAPPGVGRRRVDATRPWPGRALGPGDPGAEMVVTGPVVSPQSPQVSAEPWPSEAEQHWAADVTEQLAEQLNRPDEQAHAPDPGPPVVGPPLYGSSHARQARVATDPVEAAAQPAWFRELNLDPRDRIVGGLGTRVVQAEQEDLMLSAWNQVLGVEAANRSLRLAQLAKHVSASLHRRHLARLPDAALLAATERVHAKVLDAPQRSVWATTRDSSLPNAVLTGAFQRLTRVRGPVVRAGVRAAGDRAPTVEALTVQPDRSTTDWVRRYALPDGIGGIGPLAAARITDAVVAAVAPGSTREELLSQWAHELASPAPADHLNPADIGAAQLPEQVDLSRVLTAALAQRLLLSTPDAELVEQDAQAATTAVALWMLLRRLTNLIGTVEVPLPRGEARRLRLEPVGEVDELTVLVLTDSALELGEGALGAAHQLEAQPPLELFEEQANLLAELVERNLRPAGDRVHRAVRAVGAKVVLDDPYAEPARGRISAPALDLVTKLDPAVTVPARVTARLTSGSGRLPGWVQPAWFDDLRIEPVMAHPRFRYPMYEPLHRYDQEWMVPGLGLIDRPDLATLLETNNRFVEGYLVGLNHEMGRELLWREYPTDQRGTYFSSFWTGADELVADLHQAPWGTGSLGTHLTMPDGQLVLLVRGDLIRRYPGVVAHAVREAGDVDGIPVFEADPPVDTLFHIHLPPNVLLVGFRMTRARINTAGETWWFTLSENPTEPRFGLDPSRDGPLSRDSLVWADLGVSAPGQFLDATLHTRLEFVGAPGPDEQRARWGASSAQVAFLLFQLPARAAFRGTTMVAGAIDG